MILLLFGLFSIFDQLPYCVLRLPNLYVIILLESIDVYCAEGCRIIRGAEFLEDIRY